ncbi:MAG: methionyl-tRNA formyltransferase [Planctomycetes bacterium]|nr:methionyl-tRNA formyltransferase [Planctomycetota bacterium]
MKIVFFGCGDYARPSLRALVEGGFRPELVVTKPDAPRGRGRKIYPQEVRLEAEELGLTCAQPEDPHAPEFVAELRSLAPTVGIVVSYGVILKPVLIDLPPKGLLNAHASLLPAYRGAAPVEHAIRAGETRTGVTIMRIVPELDAGDVLLRKPTDIGPRETAGELRDRMAELSGVALCEALELVRDGRDTYAPQDHTQATRAPKIEKPDGVIDWGRPAVQIDRLVRAMTPKPGAQTRLGAKRYIVISAEVEDDLYGMGMPGGILSAGEEGIRVCTGKDLLRIIRIKPDNGRNMSAGEFVRGHPLPPDARFT